MSESHPKPSRLREPAGDFAEITAVPSWAILAATGTLVLLAALGAYKGMTSVRPGAPGSSLLSPDSLTTGKPVEAAPVAPLPHDPNWSTLKGPQILTPAPAKAAPKPVADDADSDDAADDTAAADAAAPDMPVKPSTPDDKAATNAPPADATP